MTVSYYSSQIGKCYVTGLSTDTKPVNPMPEWTYIETDTGFTYSAITGQWIQIPYPRNHVLVSLPLDTARTPSMKADVEVIASIKQVIPADTDSAVMAQVDNSGGGIFTTIETSSILNPDKHNSCTQNKVLVFIVPRTSQYKLTATGTGVATTITSIYELTL